MPYRVHVHYDIKEQMTTVLTLQHTRELGFKGTQTITEEVSVATNVGSHSMKSVYIYIYLGEYWRS